ncbi:presenilins-associated rhomboid-like protein, mitochondrial [Gadus chalcogrammus]|uniref:presenilins-associated rhomboid-like protein, mitochondrial n=1 Tax=Gadus chalcogrammus TaxID=1042646 RepID=UPI0024C4E39F|nr:presenilins-associated rhomboid-like protein, mitochondrial [Gadus chalcogrammus]
MAWSGCVLRSLARQELLSSASRTRLKHGFQQRSAFRRPAKKTDAKRVEEEVVPSHTEASEAWTTKRAVDPPQIIKIPKTPPRNFGRLVKPLVFTVGFTGCSFAAAAIWQYESLKSRVQSYFDELRADWMEKLRPQKQGDFRKEINQWWNSLSEGQRTVTGIIAANVVVYCCWRVPAFQRTMLRYFTSDPSASKAVCSSMLLSTFSHYSLLHLAANMYVLWSFSSSAVSMLGPEQFLAVYLSAGVVSTMASYVAKTASGRFGPSLGASGAIMTVLAAVCTKMPEAKLAIIFLPMFTFTAGNALKAIVAMDAAGVVLGWRFFDHAAHLGGALFGIWYIMFGHELIWKNRDSLVRVWHNLRTRGPGGPGGPGGGANGGAGSA